MSSAGLRRGKPAWGLGLEAWGRPRIHSVTLTDRFRVKPGASFSLARMKTVDTAGIEKDGSKHRLKASVERLGGLQDRLYAENSWAVLIIFQAMDGAGKDST